MPLFNDDESVKQEVGTKKIVDGVTYIKFSQPNLWAELVTELPRIQELFGANTCSKCKH